MKTTQGAFVCAALVLLHTVLPILKLNARFVSFCMLVVSAFAFVIVFMFERIY